MGYNERKELIEKLEKERNSTIVTLITSDRYSTIPLQGIQSQIAADQVFQIITHLDKIVKTGKTLDTIDLFLYSRGGDVNSAWPIVKTIRNYSKKFNVLVPLFAHSAATLIALGADKIIMCRNGSLSPIDPTVANAFNPEKNNQSLGISVEDVTSFVDLAKDGEDIGIKGEDNITKVFEILANKVHPLALGNVKRAHTQIRLLAKKLLTLHMEAGNEKISKIVDELTERLYTHHHNIFRDEASKSIGLDEIIENAKGAEEELMWKIYKDYEEEIKLKEFFDINMFLGDEDEKILETTPVFIESKILSTKFQFKQKIKRAFPQDPNFRLQVIAQNDQFQQQVKNFRTQLLQFKSNLNAVRQQVFIPVNPETPNPQMQQIDQVFAQIDAQLNNLLGGLPKGLNVSDLKKQVEFELEFIGWIN